MIKVFLVDDERRLVDAYRKRLSEEDMVAEAAYNAEEALAKLKTSLFDVCVLDIHLPNASGIDLLGKLKEIQPTLEVVMLTGFASVDTAISAMKLGAYDYLTKPCQISQLRKVITKAYEKKSLQEKTFILQAQLDRFITKEKFIGDSKAVKDVMREIKLVANSDAPVLILGESGTGKELIAKAIYELGTRSKNAFVAINSSTLQENMLESEVFGHKRGSFTGATEDKIGLLEMANRGVLFFDEIGDMGLGIQAKFLRVLEAGTFRRLGDTREIKVDVRLICATNKNLENEVNEKKFRLDLFYRLNTFVLNLPPLRERREDIPLLCDHFVSKFSKDVNKKVSREVMDVLTQHHWPGNVRELANAIERAVLLSSGREEIILKDLPGSITGKHEPARMNGPEFDLTGKVMNLDELQAKYIRYVLHLLGNNKTKVADLLGISRSTLHHWLKFE